MHVSVMQQEALQPLIDNKGKIYVDATLGGGGHLRVLLKHKPHAMVFAFDQDYDAIERAKEIFSTELKENRLQLIHSNYMYIGEQLLQLGVSKVDGILADLGVSSFHYDIAERGFSFTKSGPLDMRMDQKGSLTAEAIVNSWSQKDLFQTIVKYGEEKFASRIVQAIIKNREQDFIKTTDQLAEIIQSALPAKEVRSRKSHPATKTFLALRIAVNNELKATELFLDQIPDLLELNGVASFISFHSLEDRLIKQRFKQITDNCICPKEIIVCERCNKPPAKLLWKKPVVASEAEVAANPRSRSAKLRAIQRIL